MEQLSAVAHQLGIDNTFIPLFFMFMILYVVLRSTFFRPFQNLFHVRESNTEGAKTEAKNLVIRAEEMMSNYRSAIKGAYDDARKVLHDADVEAKKEESKILSDASAKAKNFASASHREIEDQKKNVLESVQADIPLIASEIVTKVLGRRT